MIRTGIGFDAHRFAAGRRLVLGGVEIAHKAGLLGHSDADVLTHALMDALLGAVAEGDIGGLFPDSDPQWQDADSLELLRAVLLRLRENHQAAVVNADITVIAEEPKLAMYIDAMRRKLAECLGVHSGRVSVKATTVEKMGALGRSEGIAAMAVVAVECEEN